VRYSVDLALSGFHLRHKRAHGLLARDFVRWLRVEFLGTAAATGVLAALVEPRTLDELAGALSTGGGGSGDEGAGCDAALLESLLRVGESVGELRVDGDGRWQLAGVRARAMVDPAVDGLAALPEEAVVYGTDVYRQLGDRFAGAPPGNYLDTHGELVARTSRVVEPIFGPLLHDLVRTRRPRRVLEIGCGSGVNLRHLADASPAVTGAGLDVDAAVAGQARRNLAGWGLGERFTVHVGDVHRVPHELSGPWDLVLLMQNIYYFAGADRVEVLARARKLAAGGAVVVATAVAGTGDPAAAHLDLVLRSTAGNTGLPTVDELRSDLRAAGFETTEERRLAPLQPLRAIVAS
jgi:4-hydroxy-2,2'-bipyrrole-5-carbaldehyde O-methyltransferase